VPLILTCEHGGQRVPRAYARLFRGAERVLASHRGWDAGALELARQLARGLEAPLVATTWSRLLVDSNRSPSNPRIWSDFTSALPASERARIIERYWRPHRLAVDAALAAAAAHGRIVHVAVHSFTPELNGERRRADIGLLYDSRREAEARFCGRWMTHLRALDPELRIRRNYPYLGKADGLTTSLRNRYRETRYIGVELEINQALVGSPRWPQLRAQLGASLGRALKGSRARQSGTYAINMLR
jgi:predicted N-formylglutamate amidohydrolase